MDYTNRKLRRSIYPKLAVAYKSICNDKTRPVNNLLKKIKTRQKSTAQQVGGL